MSMAIFFPFFSAYLTVERLLQNDPKGKLWDKSKYEKRIEPFPQNQTTLNTNILCSLHK